jgi:IS66 C-terminal element
MVLNRKNALFAGHDLGAASWACVASLVETCKLNGVDPQAYFADVLTKLVNLWPASRIDELMPWAWAAARSTNKLAAWQATPQLKYRVKRSTPCAKNTANDLCRAQNYAESVPIATGYFSIRQ